MKAYGQVKGRKYPADQPEPDKPKKQQTRVCAACGMEKTIDNFGYSSETEDRISTVCRLCKMLNRKAGTPCK